MVSRLLSVSLFGVSLSVVGEGCLEGGDERELRRFRAIGYGTTMDEGTAGQRQLMAIRNGKLDAYHAMAEQVYGFRLSGRTTLSSMMVEDERLRIDVDALVRGATLASVRPIAEDVYEVIVEMYIQRPIGEEEGRCSEPLP